MEQSPTDPGRADKLMTHEYDGIREYDNPTPGWWHAVFIGSVVFSILYWGVFHLSPLGDRWGAEGRHARAVEASAAAAFAQLGELDSENETLLRLSTEEVAVARGRSIFAAKCAVCHGPNAGGLPALGLNLTDEFGKNVQEPRDVYSTIANGVAGTAMVANLPNVLDRDDCILVPAYVISLRGTNVPGGMPPEGEQIPAWEIPATDE